ncbi:MAG: hypothetical protein ABSA17_01955 [Rhabdochlamydiaceae bacterium]
MCEKNSPSQPTKPLTHNVSLQLSQSRLNFILTVHFYAKPILLLDWKNIREQLQSDESLRRQVEIARQNGLRLIFYTFR